jgi:hypothetical protein
MEDRIDDDGAGEKSKEISYLLIWLRNCDGWNSNVTVKFSLKIMSIPRFGQLMPSYTYILTIC